MTESAPPLEEARPAESGAESTPSVPGAREVLLRAAIGALLGLLPAAAYLFGGGVGRREWHLVAGIGLFLGGLTGLAGFAERLGAGRRVLVQLGLALALTLLTVALGVAAVFQAEWTKNVLTDGLDAANARLPDLLRGLKWDRVLPVLLPLGGVVAAQTFVRVRRGGWLLHLPAVALPLGLGLLDRDDRGFVLTFGLGLFVANALAAWGARRLARRWWPPESAG